jgi:hypothetical protein
MSDTPLTGIIDAMPFDQYQAVPAVSKSFLDEFARCPLAGYEYMTRGSEPPTKAMVLGSAVDCLLCEPDQFDSRFHIRPETYESDDGEKPLSGNAKACKEWIKTHRDKPVLTAAERDEALEMVRAIEADPKAANLLHGCKVQQSVFWTEPTTGLQLKGRPDFIGPGYAIDLKTTRDASETAISRTIASYRYYVQAALYSDGLKANGVECEAFYFIFVEAGARPKPNVRKLKQEALELGRMVYHEQLLKVRDCFKANNWPGFSGDGDNILEIDVPTWCHANNGGAFSLTIAGEDMPI